MTMDRRTFAKRSLLSLGGLLVGEAALEQFERLNHRKVWTGADFGPEMSGRARLTMAEQGLRVRFGVYASEHGAVYASLNDIPNATLGYLDVDRGKFAMGGFGGVPVVVVA